MAVLPKFVTIRAYTNRGEFKVYPEGETPYYNSGSLIYFIVTIKNNGTAGNCYIDLLWGMAQYDSTTISLATGASYTWTTRSLGPLVTFNDFNIRTGDPSTSPYTFTDTKSVSVPPYVGFDIHAFVDSVELSASGVIVETGQTFTTPAGVQVFPTYPSSTYTIKVTWEGTSKQQPFTMPVLPPKIQLVNFYFSKISTLLTLNASKTEVVVGDTVVLSGRLTRPDTGAGLSGATIKLQQLVDGTWTEIGSTATDSNGNYSFSSSFSTPGSFDFRTVYAESTNYLGSTSSVVTITVTKIPVNLTLGSDKTETVVGGTINFSGALTRGDSGAGLGAQPVKLQKLNGTWTDVSSTTTASNGTYAFSQVMNQEGTFKFRSVFDGTAVFSAATSSEKTIVVGKIGTALGLLVDKTEVTIGTVVKFTGVLTRTDTGVGLGGLTVRLQRLIATTWTDEQSATTASDGSYSFSRPMGIGGVFRFRSEFAGNLTYGGATATPLDITVTKALTVLTLQADQYFAKPGDPRQFSGLLKRVDTLAGISGVTIELKQVIGAVWTTIETTTTGTDGSFSVAHNMPTTIGIYEFRANFAGDATYEPSASTPITINVVPAVGTLRVRALYDTTLLAATVRVVDLAFHSLGDVNWDGKIDENDGDVIAAAFDSVPGDPNWNPDADLNNDGKVSNEDLYIWSINRGSSAPIYTTPFSVPDLSFGKCVLQASYEVQLRTKELVIVEGFNDVDFLFAVPTLLTLTTDRNVVRVGDVITFTGNLAKRDSGEKIAGMVVDLQLFSAGGWMIIDGKTTDANGDFTFPYTPQKTGTYIFQGYFAGVGEQLSMAFSVPVTITVLSKTSAPTLSRIVLRLDVDKRTVLLGEKIRFSGTLSAVFIRRGLPVPRIPIIVMKDGGEIGRTMTDISGKYEVLWSPPTVGVFDIYAIASTKFTGRKIAESNHTIIEVT